MEQENLQETKEVSISGWLAFFLWVGVGLGAIISVVSTILSLSNTGLSAVYGLLVAADLGCLVATAILTILAFYQRKENAVALALTYVTMIAVDALTSLIISAEVNDFSDLTQTVRQFAWAFIWGAFVCSSKDVKALIPVETRLWKGLEKLLLAAYICIEVAIISMPLLTPNSIISDEARMEALIDELNTSLSTEFDADTELQYVNIEDDNLTTVIRIPKVEKAAASNQYWEERSVIAKHSYLSSVASDSDWDVLEGFRVFFRNGYGICYKFLDQNYDMLNTYSVSPEEYEEAFFSSYRCPTAVINSMISQYHMEDVLVNYGGCTVTDIVYNEDLNVLDYTLRLPEMTKSELANLTQEVLDTFVDENWDDFEDNIVELCEINDPYFCFHFQTSTGADHVTVRLKR